VVLATLAGLIGLTGLSGLSAGAVAAGDAAPADIAGTGSAGASAEVAAGNGSAVLARLLEATGGAAAWKELRGLRIIGEMGVAGELERVPFVIEWRRPLGLRLELELGAGTTVQAFDGTTGWAVMPGAEGPVRLSPAQVLQLVQQTDPVGPLLRRAIQGGDAGQAEQVEVGTLELVRIQLEDEQGQDVVSLLDPGSGLELQREWTGLTQGEATPMQTVFRDYRQVGPLVLAHHLEVLSRSSSRVTIVEVAGIELDPDLPGDRFTMPGPPVNDGEVADQAAGGD
jgi:hypothetical protein